MAPVNAPTVASDHQPHAGARSKVSVNTPMPAVSRARPARSIRRGASVSRDSLIANAPISTQAAVSGMLSAKIHRQPTVWVSMPPISGPAALPRPAMPYASPIMRPDCAGGNAFVMTLTDAGKISAAPAP